MSPQSVVPTTAVVVVLALAGATTGCSSGDAAGEAPRHHRVEVRGLAFVPATLQVSPGDTVTWTNRDVVPHTVTAARGGQGGNGWSSGQLREGDGFELVVPDGADTLSYVCLYHPTMTGRLELR